MIYGVAELRVAAGRQIRQAPQQRPRVVFEEVREPGSQRAEQLGAAAQKTHIKQADRKVNVVLMKLAAFIDRSHGMARLYSGVPQNP